jgi:hypothetical protein
VHRQCPVSQVFSRAFTASSHLRVCSCKTVLSKLGLRFTNTKEISQIRSRSMGAKLFKRVRLSLITTLEKG